MTKRKKIFNISVTAAFSLCFILLAVFVFSSSYLRLGESLWDLVASIKYYIFELFGVKHKITPTVTDYSNIFQWDKPLPPDYDGFKSSTEEYFTLLGDEENFKSYVISAGWTIGNFLNVLTAVIPALIALYFIIKAIYRKGNTNHNKDTKPLKIYKKIVSVTYAPAKEVVCDYIAFVKEHSWIWKCWLALWILNLNLAAIVISFIAYYFYFAMSFNLVSIYVQVHKLIIDLSVLFNALPWWCWLIIAWPLFTRFRMKIAMMRLRHFEAKNCGFINELPIVSITCGSMGKKKTTAITDMVLSQEVMFKQKAESILQKSDMKFPYFPWICFEKELQKCIEFGTVYNLATAKAFVKKKRMRFERHGNAGLQLYGYTYEKYGMEYDDALKISPLFEVLETYAQAYFIFVIQSSLIVANYSIRTDNALIDQGNFGYGILTFSPKVTRRTAGIRTFWITTCCGSARKY